MSERQPPSGQPRRTPDSAPQSPPDAPTDSSQGDGTPVAGAAPHVDESLLRALVRNELPESRMREIYRWVHTVPAWNEAHTRIVAEELRRREQGQ